MTVAKNTSTFSWVVSKPWSEWLFSLFLKFQVYKMKPAFACSPRKWQRAFCINSSNALSGFVSIFWQRTSEHYPFFFFWCPLWFMSRLILLMDQQQYWCITLLDTMITIQSINVFIELPSPIPTFSTYLSIIFYIVCSPAPKQLHQARDPA